jgi:hypothetical protein
MIEALNEETLEFPELQPQSESVPKPGLHWSWLSVSSVSEQPSEYTHVEPEFGS